VALYITDSVRSERFSTTVDERFEILWIKTWVNNRECYIAAVYHPPEPKYPTDELLSHIESVIDGLNNSNPNSLIIVAGDLNQLSNDKMCALGLLSIVKEPTHAGHLLDRIYTSEPIFPNVKVLKSAINTKHCAVVARPDMCTITDWHKTVHKSLIRSRTPTQHASYLQTLASKDWSRVLNHNELDAAYDCFTAELWELLNCHYPMRSVSVTSRDPPFVTPHIKLMLREKSKLMRGGHKERADALAQRIGLAIIEYNVGILKDSDPTSSCSVRDMWDKVRQLTGQRRTDRSLACPNMSADDLNVHYANLSQDPSYREPQRKDSCSPSIEWPTEYAVFRALEGLEETAPGLDSIPSWFLKLSAPSIAVPLSYIYRLSISQSVVPSQWKTAVITPVPKVSQPNICSDFRPISLTSILSRVLEKLFVRRFIYPLFSTSPLSEQMSDQYAFRPTGSTTAALIGILASVTEMLKTEPYVHVIAFDMSKAFDTVRHTTLFEKLAVTPIQDYAYNWMTDFFSGRQHTTKYAGSTSCALPISASVVQGSSIGPAMFILNASDLHPITSGNKQHKYADDFYLIVPASNSLSIPDELANIACWASANNLRLNPSKTQEMVVTGGSRNKSLLPPVSTSLQRTGSIKILGVFVDDKLNFSLHVQNVVAVASQSLYALKVLRTHGLQGSALHEVSRSTFLSRVTYALPAWWGFISSQGREQLQAVINRAMRWGLTGGISLPDASLLAKQADRALFQSVTSDPDHVLYQLLPPTKTHDHNLRKRVHVFSLPHKTSLSSNNFIERMLYDHVY
jgi:hypothetical protein